MKQKGFTLIELLAVIVILAIIALVAIPIITNSIDESKKGAAISSAYGYIDAVEKYAMMYEMDSNKYPYNLKDKILDVTKLNSDIPALNDFITVKGKKPSSGQVTLNSKSKVTKAELGINGYRVICQNDKCSVTGTFKEVTITYDLNGGTLGKTFDKVYNGEAIVLPIPTRENYIFAGWYTSDNKKLNPTETFTKNAFLQARWTKVLESIAITTLPTKKEYAPGESLDLSGMVVTATYATGETTDVTSKITSDPTTLQTNGNTTITVSYTEEEITKTATFSVFVDPYMANRVALTVNKDTSKGGTITEKDGVYTLSGQALMRSSSNLNLTTVTLYAEIKNTSRYYTSSSTDNSFAGLIIGTGNSGSYTQNNCFGLSDGWGGNVINGFTGSGGYPQINKSELIEGWNRIAITYDGSTFRMYLNGVQKATYSSASFKQTKLYIGGWNDAPYSGSGVTWGYVNGQYRNIRVYNTALPASAL